MPAHEIQSSERGETQVSKRLLSRLRWSLITGVLVAVVAARLYLSANPTLFEALLAGRNPTFVYILPVFLSVLAGLHGTERYGCKNTAVFFVITLAVTFTFEAANIAGFLPLGLEGHYTLPGPSPFGVPFAIVLIYFCTGYFSWVLSLVLTGQWSERLKGRWILIVPLIATLILGMWDLGFDPFYSTVLSIWVWNSPGSYFGVPISNYFYWFMVGLIFYLLFAIFLSKYDEIKRQKIGALARKSYWIEAVVLYGSLELMPLIYFASVNNYITQSMTLVTVLTTMFVAAISLIAIMNNRGLR
jgi:uncharacterized membrane protein